MRRPPRTVYDVVKLRRYTSQPNYSLHKPFRTPVALFRSDLELFRRAVGKFYARVETSDTPAGLYYQPAEVFYAPANLY